MPEIANDSDIIQLIRTDKREQSIAILYNRYYPKVKAYIRSRGGSIDDAKDIFQDAVLKLYLKVMENKLNESGNNIGGFLMQVSQNAWIDKVRKDKRLNFTDSIGDAEFELSSNDNGFLSILSRENNQIIEDVLSSIGEKCKELLRLSIFYSLSMKEIAARLGFSGEESAKTQHYKCKQKLINVYRENHYLKDVLRGGNNE